MENFFLESLKPENQTHEIGGFSHSIQLRLHAVSHQILPNLTS
jgi:hypothetical protein